MEPNISLSMDYFSRYAVYGVKRNGKYLYIGRTRGILLRFGGHHIVNGRLKLEKDDLLDIWWCDTSMQAFTLEHELIKRWDPEYNGGNRKHIKKLKSQIKSFTDGMESLRAEEDKNFW